jgi:hypothetical protein
MKFVITAAVVAIVVMGAISARADIAPPVRPAPFPDVPKNHWAYDAVEQLRERGILRGYPPERAAASARVSPSHRKSAARKPASRRKPRPRR